MGIRFEDFVKIVRGDFVCDVDGEKISGKDISLDIYKNHTVSFVSTEDRTFVIGLKPFEMPITKYDPEADWVKEYKKQFGTELSFF
jgi:hypothetical protein